MMRLLVKKIHMVGLLGLFMTACTNTYYTPVHNELGNAVPLGKNDIIRVLVPHNLPELTKKTRENGEDWQQYLKAGLYEMSAKTFTEERLSEMGYQLINTDAHRVSDKRPTVIALVYSFSDPKQDHDTRIITQTPAITDEFGQPTLWDTDAIVITMHKIAYKVKLIRPTGQDNPLFKCDMSNPLGLNRCIAPEHPENYLYLTS